MAKTIISIICCFAITCLQGQEDNFSNLVTHNSFSWKPFTIELNKSKIGYGVALEKEFVQDLFFRLSYSTDAVNKVEGIYGNKIGFGALYNYANHNKMSLRTGVDLGIMQHSDDSLLVFVGGPAQLITQHTIMTFIEIPLLMQFRLHKSFSVDLGMSLFGINESEFLTDLIFPSAFGYPSRIDKNLFNSFKFALRYTICE